jgi:hypothetical protein
MAEFSGHLAGRLAPPVIVVGMHRSGTSMVSRLLDCCGLYVGHRLGQHHEAAFFRRLNDRVLVAGGGRWEAVEPYLRAREDENFVARSTALLRQEMETGFATGYLSLRRRLAFRLGRRFAWGWKDPRTCLVMPQWLRLFPTARVLHVIRHPLDVALSLSRREASARDRGRSHAAATLDLEYSLRLWETHVQECLRYRALGGRYFEVRFEDLAADPVSQIGRMAALAGLPTSAGTIRRAASQVDPGRQRRYAGTPLEVWLERVRALQNAAELGYA